jgi:hypothetical protein
MNGPFLPQLKFQSDTKISSPFGIQSYGKSPFLMGKSPIDGHIQSIIDRKN